MCVGERRLAKIQWFGVCVSVGEGRFAKIKRFWYLSVCKRAETCEDAMLFGSVCVQVSGDPLKYNCYGVCVSVEDQGIACTRR